MSRSPYVLAALVSAALPGVDPVRARVGDAEDLDEAVVEDARGGRWLVRAPRDAAGGVALERQAAALSALAGARQALPFALPLPVGAAALPGGGRALVLDQVPGAPLDAEDLRGDGPPGELDDADAPDAADGLDAVAASPLATSLGVALAAVHCLPTRLVDEAGLPVYEAEEHRSRRLAELDRAAATGLVPSLLLDRWERALEEVSVWRFAPTVVHGSLDAADVLVDAPGPRGRVVAVTGWGDLAVADPADALAWVVATAPEGAVGAVLAAYAAERRARGAASDAGVGERAALASELALTRWLLHGVATDDAAVVADAAAMLRELESATAEEAS